MAAEAPITFNPGLKVRTRRRDGHTILEKQCSTCERWKPVEVDGEQTTEHFRGNPNGYFQFFCRLCERDYERDRWHRRSAKSKQQSGGAAAKARSS